MCDESEFVKDNDKEPAEEGTFWTYFARRAKVPDVGGRVRRACVVVGFFCCNHYCFFPGLR